MTIQYRAVFEFEGAEAENIRRGISFLNASVKELTMAETRRLVCTYAGGSYARLSDLFDTGEQTLSLPESQARHLIDLANDICSKLPQKDIRKLRTWFDALLVDMKCLREKAEMESADEQQEPMAHTS